MKPVRLDFGTSIALLIGEFIAGFYYPVFFNIFGINLALLVIQIIIRINKDRKPCMEQRNWSSLSESYKEELKGLWQNSSGNYQDNYIGFKEWLLNEYNIILDNKEVSKKDDKMFWGIMIVLGCILIGIALAIVIISSNSKDKLIEVLENDGYNCSYDKSTCKIDDGLSGQRVVDFNNNEFKMVAYNGETNVIVIYNWKEDTSEYYLGTDNDLLINSSIDKYGNLVCYNSYSDCEKMRFVMNEIKEYFKEYLKDNNIKFLN